MKKVLISVIAVMAVVLLALLLAAQDRKYAGASACKLCHKSAPQGRQYVIWQESAHAKSFAGLSTAAAASIANGAGVADAAGSPRCLGCHAPLADKAPDLKAEGVSCEACHGPGSAYKKLFIMEDHGKAVENGLVAYPNASAVEAGCRACHESAHGKVFDFEKAWGLIKHPVPAK